MEKYGLRRRLGDLRPPSAELALTLLKLETVTGENICVDSGRHVVGTNLDRQRSGG